jgi:hypothetical protein
VRGKVRSAGDQRGSLEPSAVSRSSSCRCRQDGSRLHRLAFTRFE